MENKTFFYNLKQELAGKIEPIAVKAQLDDWNFYTNSTDENMKLSQESWDKYYEIYSDKDLYEKFLKVKNTDLSKREQKQLKNIIKAFEEELNSGDLKKTLRDKEAEIAQKINSYVYKIGDKSISKTELIKIIQTESDIQIREQAYYSKVHAGDLIADDLIELVKMRNEYSKTKGYDNYFEYKLKVDYDVDLIFLEELINNVYTNLKNVIFESQRKKYNELKSFFKVSELKKYHIGFLLNSNPEKFVNEVLQKQDVEKISREIYSNMGYDLEKFIENGNLTLDLYPRKNKNTHGFCFGIQAGKDSRILANLTNNVTSLDTLNHELGHCVYDLGISTELEYFDREPSSSAFTEAIAMMMGDIIKKENALEILLEPNVLDSFKKYYKEDELSFVSKSLLIIDFERYLYQNPDQDPKVLWSELGYKYLNIKDKEDNEWATIPHYLSHPAYYQNYFRAAIMKAQIYSHLRKTLGFITENKDTAEYMNNNIFKYGASVEEYDLIKKLTGKEFSIADYIESLR